MSGNKNDPRYNASGCHDPTAFDAVKAVTQEEKIESKASFLLRVLKFIIRESGFELLNRIELRDRASGRVFK